MLRMRLMRSCRLPNPVKAPVLYLALSFFLSAVMAVAGLPRFHGRTVRLTYTSFHIPAGRCKRSISSRESGRELVGFKRLMSASLINNLSES